jgi:hypothetical protein
MFFSTFLLEMSKQLIHITFHHHEILPQYNNEKQKFIIIVERINQLINPNHIQFGFVLPEADVMIVLPYFTYDSVVIFYLFIYNMIVHNREKTSSKQ